MQIKKFFVKFLPLFILAGIAATGCEVGMGEAIDLDPPTITITSPSQLDNVHKTVTLTGTCSDNIGVVSVEITNKDTKESYGFADIENGEVWSKTLSLPEGEITLLCTANDAYGTHSIKSIQTISLLVDETAPEGLSWYITRGDGKDIRTALKDKEFLEELDLDLFENLKYPQNQKFEIYGRMYDAMSIDTIKVILTDEDGVKIEKSVFASTVKEGESIYTPKFTFTHEDLVAKNQKLKTGIHYLKVSYYSKDNHGNEETRDLPYILWYPESDIPGIQPAKEELEVTIGNQVSLHFFDDDGLSEVKYGIINQKNSLYNTITKSNAASYINNSSNFNDYHAPSITNGITDYPTSIKVSDNPDKLKIIAFSKDINGKTNTRVINTTVVDASLPLLIITSPAENTVPNIKENEQSVFSISGCGYDTSGCSKVQIAFLPNTYTTATERNARADLLFKGSATAANGEIVKTISFDPKKAKEEGKWKIQDFSFDFDLLTDFETSSQANKPKDFILRLTDSDGNIVNKSLRVDGDNKQPEIIISQPTDNMAVCDYSHNDLVLKFKAHKSSGLGIKINSYKIERNDTPYVFTLNSAKYPLVRDGDYVKVTIPKALVKEWAENANFKETFNGKEEKIGANPQPVFTFYAEDVLGNKTSVQRAVVLSPLPYLEKISSDKMSGLYKYNDTITIQAKFSDTVKVTGSPRLKLKYNSSDTTFAYANYTSGSDSDTLSFTYTVEKGKTSDKLLCVGVDENGGSILTGTAGKGSASFSVIPSGNNLQDSKTFIIDGKAPVIESITFSTEPAVNANSDGYTYLKENTNLILTINCSEPMFVSDDPKLNVKIGTTDIAFKFQDIQDNKIIFSQKITSNTTQGQISLTGTSCFDTASKANIKDEAGNEIDISKAASPTIKAVVDTIAPAAAPAFTVDSTTHKLTISAPVASYGVDYQEYSLNDGVSWVRYSSPVTLTSGSYTIVTRQTDKAGNTSPVSASKEVSFDDTFPNILGFAISKPDGNYPAGTAITFKLFLDDKVTVPSDSATLKFTPYSSTTPEVSVPVTASSTAKNTIEFTYTVKDNDYFNGLKISSVTLGSTIKDSFNNTPDSVTTTAITTALANAECKRQKIVLDGSAPTISTYSPAKDAIVSNGNVITLTFSENVYKESGKIMLRRKGDWLIPPVLTEKEFYAVYNELDSENQQKLMRTTNGTPVVHSKTGQPVGPYKKITHGLKDDYTPDSKIKFVLDFNLGLDSGTATLDTGITASVSDIRDAFEAAGYHKQELDVTSSAVVITGNKVTITFPDTLVDGREWELYIDEGAFRDETGNLFAGLGNEVAETTPYSFWSNKVAKPWIRVDRYSHGWGAVEPTVKNVGGKTVYDSTKTISTYGTASTTANSGATIAPSGYARVRIDCETPGAAITYGQTGVVTKTQDTTSTSTAQKQGSTTTVSAANITGITLGAYNGFFVVGDGQLNTSRKDYVKAIATKANFTASNASYEGVFKTVVIHRETNGKNVITIEGGTSAGGMPTISGFPVRDATEDKRYGKNAYTPTGTDNKKLWYWHSYEIVSDFSEMGKVTNYTKNYYNCSYGALTFIYNVDWY